MKIRSGFVSNSSSSSYIIAYKDYVPPCECCGRPYQNIIDAIQSFNNPSGYSSVHYRNLKEVVTKLTSKIEETKRDLRDTENPLSPKLQVNGGSISDEKKEACKQFYLSEIKRYNGIIDSCKDLSKKDYEIAIISMDNNSEYLKGLFEALKSSGNIIVLDEWY